jgi:hypothetical protein
MPRAIYHCRRKACAHTWARDYPERDELQPRGWSRSPWYRLDGTTRRYLGTETTCPKCGDAHGIGQRVKGTFTACPCDPRCTSARGHDCQCSCGGANHGRAWLVCDAWNASAPTHSIVPTASRIPAAQPRLFGI